MNTLTERLIMPSADEIARARKEAEELSHKWRNLPAFTPENSPRIVAATFADGEICTSDHWRGDLEWLRFFDGIIAVAPGDLGAAFWEKHRDFMRAHQGADYEYGYGRGFGNWIWKFVVMKQILDTLRVNDVLYYLDADYYLPPNCNRAEMVQLLGRNIVNASASILGWGARTSHRNVREWTKRDVFEYFDLEREQVRGMPLHLSGHVVINKRGLTDLFFAQLFGFSESQRYYLFDQNPSRAPEPADFERHHNDDSLLSCLAVRWARDFGLHAQTLEKSLWLDNMREADHRFLREGKIPPRLQKVLDAPANTAAEKEMREQVRFDVDVALKTWEWRRARGERG